MVPAPPAVVRLLGSGVRVRTTVPVIALPPGSLPISTSVEVLSGKTGHGELSAVNSSKLILAARASS